jgi:hypothetical protein
MEDIFPYLYLGCETFIMKSNGYINMTKICNKYNKNLSEILQNEEISGYANFLAEELNIPYAGLIIDRFDLNENARGQYIHKYLVARIIQEVSFDLYMKISDIIWGRK